MFGWAGVVLLLPTGSPAVFAVAAGAGLLGALAAALALRGRRRRALPPPSAWTAGPVSASVPQARRPQGAHAGAAAPTAVVLAGLVTALLCVCAAGHLAVRDAGPMPQLVERRAVVVVEGRVDEDPRVLPGDPERPEARAAVRLLVTRVTARGRLAHVRTPIVLIGPTSMAGLRWRERVMVTGRLAGTDASERTVAILRVMGEARRLRPAGPVAGLAEHVRERLRQAVQPLPQDPRGLVPALVIGDRSLTPQLLTDDMRATGMTHLTAVSGSNVAVVLAAAVLLAGLLGVRRRWRPFVAAASLAGFVVLARPDPSVLRAAVMGAVGLLGVTASREATGPSALAGAIVVLLCVDPWLARSYGFALSVLATLGLLLFARPWANLMARRLPRRARALADATAIPLAAQATCAPVVVLLQGSVPVIGVAANLAAAVFVAPATIAGVLAALGAAVWVPAGTALAWAAALPAWAIAVVAHALAPVPFGTLPWPDGTPGALLLAALTIAALLCGPWLAYQTRCHPRPAAALGVLLLAVCWPLPDERPPGNWEFSACDVGQGDALVVPTGAGRAVLVDAGPEPEPVRACLDRLGIHHLDAVVLTHYHADHVAGLPGALAGRSLGALYVCPLEEPADQVRNVREWARAAGVEPVVMAAGATLDIGPVHLLARGPIRNVSEGSMPNNNGIVLDIRTVRLRMLLLADIEREAAADLARALRAHSDPRPVDVVKVAHHGSANLDTGLIRQIAAPVAVISVGRDNDYGHPAPRAIEAYARAGASVLRTDRDGDIVLISEPPQASDDAVEPARDRPPIRVLRSRG